jgi:hypothetical protein
VPVDHSIVVGVAVTVADRPGIAAVGRDRWTRSDAEPRLEVDHHPIGRWGERGLGLRDELGDLLVRDVGHVDRRVRPDVDVLELAVTDRM